MPFWAPPACYRCKHFFQKKTTVTALATAPENLATAPENLATAARDRAKIEGFPLALKEIFLKFKVDFL